jgi:hypothetical protein
VKYELGFYTPEDGILHSHSRENLKSYNDDFNYGLIISSKPITTIPSLVFISKTAHETVIAGKQTVTRNNADSNFRMWAPRSIPFEEHFKLISKSSRQLNPATSKTNAVHILLSTLY